MEQAALQQLSSAGREDLAVFLGDVLEGSYDAASVVGAMS